MKVIFLDFDGVLNSVSWHKQQYEKGQEEPWPLGRIDPEAVAVLNEIIEKSGAQVVVSSPWRIGQWRTQIQDWLNVKGFKGTIYDSTPVKDDAPRGQEIDSWMMMYSLFPSGKLDPITHFVILDDDTDMVHLYDKLVHIDYATGLTREHIPLILKHLEAGQ